ncbi:LysM peptidoglycan-binding domain-containing protein [Piscibacillus sp. B03]|uniref:LysM peptidoglycan-binding domain-containing protein n=1 Tax=Piscibacillus sp. B03 TaxID=3457430 RepID=UPI003FCE10AF
MNYNGNEPFLFDLHEEITFRQGEEIDDLYGISIQPDVNIIKEATYIQLRGVLMVSGDYQSLPREEPMYLMDQDDDENYVQQVKALDNGFTTFQYPIPVDITIPANRVNETGEPDVEIEYFDYELPEPKSLHVYAKIRLANVEVEEEYSEERHEEDVNSDFQVQEIPSFEEDDQKEGAEEETEEDTRPHEESAEATAEVETEESAEATAEVETEESSEDKTKGREFWNKKETQSFTEFFNNKEKKAKAEEKPKAKEQKDQVEYQDNAYKDEKDNVEYQDNAYQGNKDNVEYQDNTYMQDNKENESAKENQMKQEKEEKQDDVVEEEKKAKDEAKEEAKKEKKEKKEAKKKESKKKDKKQEKQDTSPEVKQKSSKDDYDDHDQMDDEDGKKPKKKMFGLNYLSNFFRDDEELREKEKVSVKMRFVQQNETLESIAESYKVPVSQLERLNGLEDDRQLKAGDVLYVPYKK